MAFQYANWRPEMCLFLLQHGADVDHFAPNATDHMFAGTALDQALNHDEADQDQLQDLLECRRLLLEAGCDPTVAMVHVEDHSSLMSPAEETFFNGELVGRIPRQLKIVASIITAAEHIRSR
jgi:hypothetical protein